MPTATQKDREFRVTSPLGEDKLLFLEMTASEQLGRLFHIQLDMLSEDDAITIADLLGQSVTVEVDLPRGGTRYFNGLCTKFSQVGQYRNFVRYRAELRPWFWILTRSSDCKIFQELSIPDIIKQVFREFGFVDFEDKLTGSYSPWEYCVQYRETHFNFISRLMEQAGIYYYFKHQDGKHTLVLADGYSSHEPYPGYAEVRYFPPDDQQRRDEDHIHDWILSQEVQTGSYVYDDYDFEKPRADLMAKASDPAGHPHASAEMYDYPGEYVKAQDGDKYAKIRLQEQQLAYEQVTGQGDVRGLMAGGLFQLGDYPRQDQNREYLVMSAKHQLQQDPYETSSATSEGPRYMCTLTAMDSGRQFRTPRITPTPIVQGPQTAVVVGPSGQEIWTDKYGRVKVQFHWDRYGKSDENSSCWIRVGQIWSGKTWGAFYLPRIGHEVIVEFLEGDPDRPIITGNVYNGDNKVPYSLPDNQTQSGIKSRSTKKGDAQKFNELRFEDKIGEEHIYFHAEKDFERVVENNDSLKVGFDVKDKGDQTIDIYNDRTTTLEKGHEKLQVKTGNRTVLVDKGDDTHKVGKGSRSVEVFKDDSLTVKTGNQTIKVSAGKTTHEAAQSILLKVGASSIKIEPAKITIKSPQIAIQGDAMIEAKAPMTTVKGDATLILKGGMLMIN